MFTLEANLVSNPKSNSFIFLNVILYWLKLLFLLQETIKGVAINVDVNNNVDNVPIYANLRFNLINTSFP